MADKSTVLCADQLCVHNSGGGYYGVCNNPERTTTIYCGIDRMYMSTCRCRKSRSTIKDDGEKLESGLLEED